MKKHAKSKKHILRMGLLAVASLVWLIIKTGSKPSRITYPCQRAAAANVQIFLLVLFASLLGFRKFRIVLPAGLKRHLTKVALAMCCLLLVLGSIPFMSNYITPANNGTPVPFNLEPQKALSLVNSSSLFFIENAPGFEGSMDRAISALLKLMEAHGLFFFKTASTPEGLIGKDDVIIIKVNCQWPERGGTNTDLVKSLIKKIVNHPEGFIGEIVIADNGQGVGNLNWPSSNAFNHSQSMQDVVDMFPSHKISTWLWDSIESLSVNEYDQGDISSGYIVNSTANPITQLRVSYPKFKTKYGTYISFKKGIWDGSSYDSERLKVVNVPVLKSHVVYAVTACVKNYMGVVSQSLSSAHSRVKTGGMGTEMAETRVPILNILDSIWVNANPVEGGNPGPSTSYAEASFTNIIGASQDPVALECWASKHILIPAAISEGYSQYSSLDPNYAPITPGLSESYHNYLERSMNELKRVGYWATMNETEMNVYVSQPSEPVHNLDTGLSYTTIQAAIDANETLNGHRIFVEEGVYYEHVVASKSISLIGANKDNTIIDGNSTGHAMYIIAHNVVVANFTVRNAGKALGDGFPNSCILANNVINGSIENNIVADATVGIFLWHSTNVTVRNNLIHDCGLMGIHLDNGSSQCTIAGNTVRNNLDGIEVEKSSENLIEDNSLAGNNASLVLNQCGSLNVFRRNNMSSSQYNLVIFGYELDSFMQNIDNSNLVNNKTVYYFTSLHDLIINPSGCPNIGYLALVNCTNIVAKDFNITRNGDGITLAYSADCTLTNITLSGNRGPLLWGGLTLYSSNNNTIVNTRISSNSYATCFYYSNGNMFYHNSLINNDRQAVSDFFLPFSNMSSGYFSTNVWDDGFEGNYWSDYAGTDSDMDGIGDSSYELDENNIDNHPLMGMFYSFNVSPGYFVDVISNSTIENFQYYPSNSTIKMYASNISATQSLGFCRLCIPKNLMTPPYAVVIDDGLTEVLYFNGTLYDNGTHRWVYFAYQHSTHKILVVPEFTSFVMSLIMIATLIATVVYGKKKSL